VVEHLPNKYEALHLIPTTKQTKTTLRFHLTLFRMAVIKKQKTIAGEDSGKEKPIYTVVGRISPATLEISI
jgi:hypothetical protein